MLFDVHFLIVIGVSFALALLLTPVVRGLTRRWGFVARPVADRWHKKPTAMMGGVAIFLTVFIVFGLFLPPTPYTWVVIVASAFLFAVGLVDDLLHIKPYQKLIGQVMGAAFVIYYGLSLPWTGSPPVNMAITIFWLIGITNAVNLLDNMDGLAAGNAAIAALFLAISFINNGQPAEALLVGTFAAALLGFLVYNSKPASIFMGDCGSMFIGFFLASASLMSTAGGRLRQGFLAVLAVPVLILLIPIFDTTFVTILRKLSGRAASQGGRDHTSHRLVALGMSERRAVWMLYGFALLSGGLAMLVRRVDVLPGIAAILGFTILLVLLGVYLAGVKVYDEEEVRAAHEKPIVSFLIDLSYKRRVFEVMLDLLLIMLAYYASYALLFGTTSESGAWRLFARSLPVLVFMHMAAFLVMGVYRGIWRYVSVDNLIVYAKAVAAGTAASVCVLLLAFRFAGFSRAAFAINAIILFFMLAGSRIAFRLFRQLMPTTGNGNGRRALIYGAGDAGELLLREMRNNHALNYRPVGFVDDDPLKKDRVIHGLRVFGGNGNLRHICTEQQVEEVLISSSKFSDDRIAEILHDCDDAQITLKRMRIELEKLSGD